MSLLRSSFHPAHGLSTSVRKVLEGVAVGKAEGEEVSDNWNFASFFILTLVAFAVGHVSGRVSFNVITVLCGLFILVVANGAIVALRPVVKK